ncbi:MAG TPA: RNA polymerase sigma factor [Woeseiaceae bacterium]|jgi:RNA polymerase sigma-70 factor (ECF subfamily)|nr:RNA polymerase sigma factor [Woeseiaceae bacterium]
MAESDRLFETFVALRSRLARLVRGIVPPKEVEDIVQETYVRVCQVEHKAAIREPRSFLFRTAQNLALDHLKSAESRLTAGVESIDDASAAAVETGVDTTYAQVATDEEFVLFCQAVRNLPQQCRRAFVLKKVYGYTLKEIAVEMGVGQPTVESHIVAGTKRCVKYLRDRGTGRPAGMQSTVRRRTTRRGGGE